ncbi:ARM repeat-containing protein [Ramicandelaber brevisporus]|nr:ARM repeat-containing protein [Ramicandelaber brevisporus]
MTKTAQHQQLEDLLLNKSGNTSLAERFRVLFSLKGLGDAESVEIIGKAFADDSALLKHELAYVLGQIGNPAAIPVLERVLETMSEDAMVRHEAAEALGAIAQPESLSILEKYLKDGDKSVRETCEIAIDKIRFDQAKKTGTAPAQQNGEEGPSSVYASVDPAPAGYASESTDALRGILLDAKRPLFERYRAMFALRNRGDRESVLALAEGLNDESALFRHEIGFVFGQMQNEHSVPALIKSLENMNEIGMVRHECAEALGSIATDECYDALRKFVNDPERVVRESCIVALDMYEYERSGEHQYAIIPPTEA